VTSAHRSLLKKYSVLHPELDQAKDSIAAEEKMA